MPTQSLIGIGQDLGRTTGQLVKLGDLRRDGYTRTYAVDGYYRVNPFEVEDGVADDPDRNDDFHYLGNWYGYVHEDVKVGTQVSVEGGHGEATVTFSTPDGYDRAPEILAVKAYAKSSGYTGDSPGETQTSTEPRTSPDTTDTEGYSASEPTEITLSLASFAGEWVAISLTGLFDDSDSVHESTSEYAADAGETYPLTGGDLGVLAKIYETTPSITDVDQNPAPGDCFIGTGSVDITLDLSMEGPSLGTLQRSTDGGSNWTTVATNIPAGSSSATDPNRSTGTTYTYRLRYNDVSPNQWSNEASHFAECTKV